MAGHAHATPLAQQDAVGTDKEGAALYAAYLLAVHVFHFDDAEQRTQRFAIVRDQGKRQLLLLGEALVRLERVARHADDMAAGIDEVLVGIPKLLCLGRAARRVVLGVKVKHGSMVAQAGQGYLPLSALRAEFGHGPAHGDLGHAVSCKGSKATTTRRPSAIRIL